MRSRVLTLTSAIALTLAIGLALIGAGPTLASQGGCPSERAATGADHANLRSAHGLEKQADRGCTDAVPTPTPGPTEGADIRVEGVSVRAPDVASVGVEFPVRASVTLRNLGPADSVLADTTFVFTAPADCSVSPTGAITVEDTTLPRNVGVGVSRTWLVVCSQTSDHTFSADVDVAIDPGEPISDPDPTNNSGSGSDTTNVTA